MPNFFCTLPFSQPSWNTEREVRLMKMATLEGKQRADILHNNDSTLQVGESACLLIQHCQLIAYDITTTTSAFVQLLMHGPMPLSSQRNSVGHCSQSATIHMQLLTA